MHDSRVLRNSSLFQQAEQLEILTKPDDVIDNVRVRPLLLGDGGYPLCTWLTKPYHFTPALNNTQKKFNKKLSSARATVERSFGVCKARWRCLLKQLDCKVENVSEVIICCFALHNFCQINGEIYYDEDGMLEAIIQNEAEAIRQRLNNAGLPDAERIRSALADYVDENY